MSLRSCGDENRKNLVKMDFKKWKGKNSSASRRCFNPRIWDPSTRSISIHFQANSLENHKQSTFTARIGKKLVPPFLSPDKNSVNTKHDFQQVFRAVNTLARCFSLAGKLHTIFRDFHVPHPFDKSIKRLKKRRSPFRTLDAHFHSLQLLSSSIRCVNMCGKST